MVDFGNPDQVGIPTSTGGMVKFWHALNGLYIWEFLTTLDYEWSVIQGRRPHRWTIWLYSLTRVGTLVAMILHIIFMDVKSSSICEVVPITHFTLANMAVAAASFLIVLRIIAIWNGKKVVVGIAALLWLTNVAFLIHSVVKIRFVWVPAEINCVVVSIKSLKLALIVTLITDIVLLLIMLAGLLCLHCPEDGMYGLQRLLWNQGVIWLLLVVVSEVPPVAFIILNLNMELNLMFLGPALITMTIAASRMHRGLVDFARGSADIPSSGFKRWNISVPKTQGTPVTQIAFEQVDSVEHTIDGQYPSSLSSQHVSDIDTDKHPRRDTPDGLAIDADIESGMVP